MKRLPLIFLIIFLIHFLPTKMLGQVSYPEILGCPTDHSVTVNVITDQSLLVHFQYSTTSGSYSETTSNVTSEANVPLEVVIDGLSANTKYYYRMRYSTDNGTNWAERPEYSFMTQRPVGSDFKFTIISDSHAMYNTQYAQSIVNVGDDQPDFHLDLGDTFMTDNMTNQNAVNNAYLAQRESSYMGGIGHSVPIFLASGNHENEEGWNFDDSFSIGLASILARKMYYPTPVTDGFYSGNIDPLAAIDETIYGDELREDYYTWEWGDALFVVIDPYQYTMTNPYGSMAGEGTDDPASGDRWNWTLGQQQFNWFKQTIEDSNAKYKFVFAHHMVGGSDNYVRGGAVPAHMFEWGGYNIDGTTWGFDSKRTGWGDDPIHQLMIDNGVSAFFHGHDHQYAYEVRDGIVYQSLPRPSTGLDFNYYSESNQYTEKVLASPGHLRVSVTPDEATVEYVNSSSTSASISHSYTIDPNEVSATTYDLTMGIEPVGSGATDPLAGVHSYTDGSVVTITATPAEGYVFDHWASDVDDVNSATTTVLMDENQSVTAVFTEEVSAGAVVYLGDIGSATSATDGGTLTIDVTSDYGVGNTVIIGIASRGNQNLEFSVTDSQGNSYDEAVQSVCYTHGRSYIFYGYIENALTSGDVVTISSTPDVSARVAVASVFSGLLQAEVLDQSLGFPLSNGEEVSNDTPSVGPVTTVQGNELIIGAIGTEGPVGDDAGTWGNSFMEGPRAGTTGATYDWTISLGYRFVSSAGDYTAAKTGITPQYWAATIATFKAADVTPPVEYTIEASAGSNGSIDPSGSVAVTEGEDQSFTITAGTGYLISDVLVDGSSVGAVSEYEFTDVQADHTIAASFEEIPAGTVVYLGEIGSASSKTSGSNLVINTTLAVAEGNEVIVAFATYGDPDYEASVTDDAGNTYEEVAQSVCSQHGRTFLFAAYNVNPLAVGSNITISHTSVSIRSAVASAFDGLADINPLDQSLGNPAVDDAESISGTSPSVGPTGMTTQSNELLIGAIGTEGPFEDAAGTWENSFIAGPRAGTTGGTDTDNWTISMGYRMVSSADQYTAQKSGITSRYWAAVVATFKTENILPSSAYNILLCRPTDNSVTASAIMEQNGEVSCEYGTSSGDYSLGQTSAFAVTADEPIEIIIDGLNPNTEYFYRILFRENSTASWSSGEEYSFHTQKAQNETFTFTIISDSHLGQTFSGNSSARYEQATRNIASDHPDFHIDLGDAFIMDEASSQADANNVYQAQRPYFGNFSHSSPVFLTIGNHENEEGWNLDDIPFSPALGSILARKQYFPNPVPDEFYTGNSDQLPAIGGDQLREDYYSWEWGDALFIVLDPFQYTMTKPYGTITGSGEDDDETISGDQWNWTLGQQQFNWFKQTLEGSDAKYKFVFSHHPTGGVLDVAGTAGLPSYVRGGAEAAPYFEWGGLNADETEGFSSNRSGWGDDPIHQLMVDNGVSAFFHGHDHQFVHEERDGIVYQLVPSPGMDDYGFDLYDESPYVVSGGNLPNSGHLRLTVSSTQTSVEYVRSEENGGGINGQVSYSYTIDPLLSSTKYTITASSGVNGSIDPSGEISVYEGRNRSFIMTPELGYQVADVLVDGVSVGAVTEYEFNDVQADHTIEASFEEVPPGTITYLGEIGSATANDAGTELVIPITSDVVAGNTIMVGFASRGNPTYVEPVVTDEAGNTYNLATFAVSYQHGRSYLYYAHVVNDLSLGDNIIITTSSLESRVAVASAFNGLLEADVLDQSLGNPLLDSETTAQSNTPLVGPTGTTSQENELLVGIIGTEDSGTGDAGAGAWENGFSDGPTVKTSGASYEWRISMGYSVVTSTGEFTASKTYTNDPYWAANIATFKAISGEPVPTTTITDVPLGEFYTEPGVPSIEQSYTVSGTILTEDITITAPVDFEISLSSESDYGSSLVLVQTDGSVPETTIFVRFNRATEGSSGGDITHVSNGATTQVITVSGTAEVPVTNITSRVAQSSDDAEEDISNGEVDIASTDLELIYDGTDQLVGVRFQNIQVPSGAIIHNAYIEFQTDETTNENPCDLVIYGQAADNPETFSTSANNISDRAQTTASVAWSPDEWNTVSQNHQTSDISAVVQEIIDRGGWSIGNSMVFIVEGSGQRVAESFDGEDDNAPLLVIDYTLSTDPKIEISGIPLTAFSSIPGTPSEEQSYVVSGINLTEDIVIDASANFEISTTSGSEFGSTVTLAQSDGLVAATIIYVRFNRATEGMTSGDITHSSSGATSQFVSVNGDAIIPIEGWTAYNDCVYESGEDGYIGANVTTFGVGDGFTGDTSGELLDQDTGDLTGITVSLTQSGGVTWQSGSQYGGEDTAEGTDANDTFGDITDMTGVIQYGEAGWYVDLTFSGLDPTKHYTFATSSSRNNDSYADRYTKYTLSSVEDATNSSTTGVNEINNLSVWFNTGDNHDDGYVARWTDIQPGSDGSIVIRAEAHPDANDSGRKAYAFDVFMLQEESGGTSNQTPDQPTLIQPINNATDVSDSPTLEVTVSDPDADALDVTFYGRKVSNETAGEDFTIIGLPDTQFYSDDNPDTYFIGQTQWIVDNQAESNIVYVAHEGDIVNIAGTISQWDNADEAMSLLEDPSTTGLAEGIPYGVVPGNHDTPTTQYNNYFGVSRFVGRSYYGGNLNGNNDNNYTLFSASGMDFIVVNLQYEPGTTELNWADERLKEYSDRRAIVVSHSILNVDDSWRTELIYTELEDNPNLFLMLCGHMHQSDDGAALRTETGSSGNTIYVLLADYQDYPNGGNGYLRSMRFSPANNKIFVETYSPILDASLTDSDNKFELVYEMAGSDPFEVINTVSSVASGGNASITWPDLDLESEYEWYVDVSDGSATTTGSTWSFTTEDIPPTIFTLTMAANPSEGGTTSPTVGTHDYEEGMVVNITATPEDGYVFDHWEGDVTDVDNASTTVIVDESQTVTAHFTQITYDLTIVVDPVGGGIIDPEEGIHTYAKDEDVIISAAPAYGYVFDHWEGDVADANSATTTVAMDEDQTITAYFDLDPTNHFSIVWSGNGVDHMNFYVLTAEIDDIDMQAGDEVGIFDGDLCVGAGKLTEVLIEGENYLSIPVSKDDSETPEIDGYTEGNSAKFKLWDVSLQTEISYVITSYEGGDEIFELGGSSTVHLDGYTILDQTIELSLGWNIFSLNVEPMDVGMSSIVQPLIDDGVLVKVQDEAGFAIENVPGIGWVNGIEDWRASEGYKIRVTENTQLNLSGYPIATPFAIDLLQGWNIIGYPLISPQGAMEAFNSMITQGTLVKVQDEAGYAIEDVPGIGWVDGISNLDPGEGYKVRVNADEQLVLSEQSGSSLKSAVKLSGRSNTGHFKTLWQGNGLDQMNIYFTKVLANNSPLLPGDEIAVFDGDICVGSAVVANPNGLISIIASKDDPTTIGIDGFIEGHPLSFKVWTSNVEWSIKPEELSYAPGYSKVFVDMGTTIASINAANLTVGINDNSSDMEFNLYPNPFSDEVTFTFNVKKDMKMTISIYNTLGQKIYSNVVNAHTGSNIFRWDATDSEGEELKPGLFIMKVIPEVEVNNKSYKLIKK